MDAGNAVTPLCSPNFQNEVLAPADASAVDSSAVPTLLRFPLAGREDLRSLRPLPILFPSLFIQLASDLVEMCLRTGLVISV